MVQSRLLPLITCRPPLKALGACVQRDNPAWVAAKLKTGEGQPPGEGLGPSHPWLCAGVVGAARASNCLLHALSL